MMPHPLKAQKQADGTGRVVTNVYNELINLGVFTATHSTKQQIADEGHWMLIVAQKHKSKEASAFFSKLMKHVGGRTKGQTPIEACSNTVAIPVI
jgi:ribosomal protein S19E (S16A)